MPQKYLNFGFILAFTFLSCSYLYPFKRDKGSKSEIKVVLKTTHGTIKLKLYNETPKHRDNFIKLVNDHFYDGLLFHRVIQSFMIQGGDPDSKNSKSGVVLGNGEVGYTIPGEFDAKLFHKKGALAAARQSDDVNPKRESSGCQFYIVQGRFFNDSLLNFQEQQINNSKKQMIFNAILNQPENQTNKASIVSFQQRGQMDSVRAVVSKFEAAVESEFAKTTPYKFSEEQRKAYTSLGGAPHLDGAYTIYGEVTEGLDIVDKIAAVPVDGTARPIEDVKIIKAYIVRK